MELIDEAPELEPLPSQRGGSVEEGEAGGVWYYSLEAEVEGDHDHPHPPTIMQHRRDNPKVSLNVGGQRCVVLQPGG